VKGVRTLFRFFAWLGGHGPVVLSAALIVVIGAWAFVQLADEVREGETRHFDTRVMSFVAEHRGPRWLQESGRDITAMGSITVLSLVTLAVAGYFLLAGKRGSMLLILGATIGGLLIGSAIKALVDRARPDLFAHGDQVYTSSFPSGHSMMSAVVYLTLGALLTRLVQSRILKLYFLLLALAGTVFVGISRIYMGVHWPTDVLAGWTAGLVWALICWLVARALQRRGKVEEPEPPAPEESV
jgi:undecaprenyl-diphosphatase